MRRERNERYVAAVPRYDAFISYSHAADGRLAPELQTGLQRLAKPWNRRRALEVFRDQTGLAVTPHLWDEIVDALDTAEWFVLLASPDSAGSEWVGKEITHWLERPNARDRILPVLTDGVWDWAETGGFTPECTAVNPALHDAFTDEPFFLDLTWAKSAEHLDLGNPQFRDSIAALAGQMHGKSPDELIGADVQQFKLARRLRRAAVIGLATLTVAALFATGIAVSQRNKADRSAAQSRSRELAALARSKIDDDPGLASILAVEANYPNGATKPIDVPDARMTLGVTLRKRQWAAFTRVGPQITARATHIVTEDSRHVATMDYGTCTCRISWWDAHTGQPVPRPVSAAVEKRLTEPFGTSTGGVSFARQNPPSFGDFPITVPFTVDQSSGMLIGMDPATTGDLVVQPAAGGPVVSRLRGSPGAQLALVTALPSGQVVAVSTTGDLYEWSRTAGGAARRIAYTPPVGNTVQSIAPAADNRIVVESVAVPTGYRTLPCARVCIDNSTVTSDVPPFSFLGSQITAPHADVIDISDASQPKVVRTFTDAAVTVPGSDAVSPASTSVHRYLAARSIGQDAFGDAEVDVWDIDAGRLIAAIPRLRPTDLRWLDPTTLAVVSARGVENLRLNVPPVLDTTTVDLARSTTGDITAILPSTPAATPARYEPSGSGRPARLVPEVDPATLTYGGSSPGRLSLSPDGRVGSFVLDKAVDPVTGSNGCVSIGAYCAPPSSVQVEKLVGHTKVASFPGGTTAAFDPTGRWLAVGRHHDIQIADTRTWHVAQTRNIPDILPNQIVWAPDGADLFVRGQDASQTFLTVSVNRATGRSRAFPTAGDGVGLAVSPDGRTIATTGDGGTVTLWARTGSSVGRVPLSTFTADAGSISGLAFSPDGARLVTSGETTTAMWDLSDRTNPARLDVLTKLPALARVHERSTTGDAARARWGLVAFNPNGRSLLLAGPTGVVELADFDPALACSLATPADLAAAERALRAASACTRVPELRRARHARAGPRQT